MLQSLLSGPSLGILGGAYSISTMYLSCVSRKQTDCAMKKPERKKIILIIEDDSAILNLFSLALHTRGFDVLEANNGLEGLKFLKNNQIDLVLTDWKMPNMNGLSLLNRMRDSERLKNLPVIMMSASEYPRVTEKAYDLGACTWIKKPFKFNKLLTNIEEALAQN